MPFEELTSDRTRRLILRLVEAMDPERYAHFFAWSPLGASGWQIRLMGVDGLAHEVDGFSGSFEEADLQELEEAGYLRLERKPDGTFAGRLTKLARDTYAEFRREAEGSNPMPSAGDPDLDDLAERFTNRAAAECTERQVKRLADLRSDLVRRGLGSSMEGKGNLEIAISYIDEFCERMLKDLLELVRKAHGTITAEGAVWIRQRLERNLDQLSWGQAGCYVKEPMWRRQLEDYIQRKKAGLTAALEIEVRTANLDRRFPGGSRKPDTTAATYDVFICHASEDKEDVACPIADELVRLGYKVWIDKNELTLGDSLRQRIEKGLASSRFGVVILSPSFFAKRWPQWELDGLAARELGSGEKVILPVWHKVTEEDVRRQSPLLAGKLAVRTSQGMVAVTAAIVQVLKKVSEQDG
jgi:hypothetical protein